MANVIINPQSGILEFNTGTAGSSVFDASLSGAARLTFNTGEVNLKSYATGVLDRFTVDGAQGRLFSVSDSLTGTIFSVNDIAGLPIIEVNSTTTDIVNIGTYGTNALVVSGSAVGMGVAAPTAKLDIRDTWNNAATTFTAVKADVTDTSSNAASLLMDLRVGGVSKAKVYKNGSTFLNDIVFVNENEGRTLFLEGNDLAHKRFGTTYWRSNEAVPMLLRGSGSLGWSSTTGQPLGSGDLFLSRDASNTLAQRNGANAQESRIYGTHSSATNFERLNLKYNATANAFQIGTEKGSAGGTARPLEFQTDGTTRMTIGTAGTVGIGTVSPQLKLHVSADSGSTYSWGEGIQVSAFNNNANFRPFVGFYRARGTEASPLDIAANDVIGSFSFISRVSGIPIYSSTVRSVAKDSAGNGRIEFYITTSGTEQLSIGIDGLNLAFGGYTSSFPAIKRSSAILQARLADDSGYTTIDAQHRLQGTVPTSATDTGTAGDIRYDANYIYICTATNTWKRVAISTWP